MGFYLPYGFHLESRIVRRAFVWKTRKFSRFLCIGQVLNCRKACLLFGIDILQPSLNQGFFFFLVFVDVVGIVFFAISYRKVVKLSIGIFAFNIVSFISDSLIAIKDGQSALFNFHFSVGSSGAWIEQWLKHSLATAATHDQILVSACGRLVVARPRSWFSPGSPISSTTYDHRTPPSALSKTRL